MNDQALRKHLVKLLLEGEAHIRFRDAVKDFPVAKAGQRPNGSPHSAWELLEHMRIAQEDIAHFSGLKDDRPATAARREFPKGYQELKWPDEYWPKDQAPKDTLQWNASVTAFENDLAAFARLVENTERDLFETFPWGDGQTLLREAQLLADHNSYHLGQLLLVRKMVE